MASVLVVDDEKDIRDAVSEILTSEGHRAIGAGDGAEALSQLRAHHPDVVLLDLMMPGMNGWDFRAAQKGDPDVSAIPVIVVSALARDPAFDAEAYLEKPFRIDALLAEVRRLARAA
jgi:CheY-like chemotaxis protein